MTDKQAKQIKRISQAILLGIVVVVGLKAATLLGDKVSRSGDGHSDVNANVTVNAAPSEVPRYGIFELALTSTGNYKNPYLLMPGDSTTPGFVVGTFTAPNGEMITIDGFWDGGRTWKIRMAPIAEGTWRYATSSTDPGLDAKSGSFNCTPSGSRGFVRVNPDHPQHFMWDDGTPFYWASVAIGYGLIQNGDCGTCTRVDDGTFQRDISVKASQGFNHTWWGYTGFEKPKFNNKNQKNEGGDVFINYDPTLLNPKFHQYLDQRLKVVLDRGFLAQIRLGWPDQKILRRIGHKGLKRYWRYLIARYAAYNVEWNLFGEVQDFGSDYLSIYRDYANLTRRWDPYKHLLSTHTVGDLEPDFASHPLLDYITLQRRTTATSDYLSYGEPVINAEYGGYESVPPPHGADPDTIRHMIWDIRMRGGYFVYESWGDDPQSQGAQFARLNTRFFQNRTRFWLLEYSPEVFGGKPGLANRGQEYVVYLKTGGSVTMDLSAASKTLNVEWYNPRTGETMAGSTIGGASVAFTAPDTNDWVLHIRRTSGN